MSRSIPQAELDAAIAYESLMVPSLFVRNPREIKKSPPRKRAHEH